MRRAEKGNSAYEKAENDAENAQNALHTAKAQLEKAQKAWTAAKAKKEGEDLEDYKMVRDQVQKVVGTRVAADEVMKETIIQKMNHDANDGIIIDVGGENECHPVMQFNHVPRVQVGKAEPPKKKSIDIEVFPGETAKPTVTMVGHDCYEWKRFGDPEPAEPICCPNKCPQPGCCGCEPILIPQPYHVEVPVPIPTPYPVHIPPPECPPPPPPVVCPPPPPEKEITVEVI